MTSAAAEIAIRARRADFNRAIAQADVAAIGPIVARGCVMLTGSDSAVISGRLAQIKVWRREFGSPTRDIYLRTPEHIEVSRVAEIAMKRGAWTGMAPSGVITARGTYMAKWRKIAGDWVIEAEVFVTLA